MEKEIKKIIINYFYGCYGFLGEMSRDYITFSKDKVRFVRKPLDKPSVHNATIEISYNPIDLPRFKFKEELNDYENDFKRLCHYVGFMKDGNYEVCDAIPPSIDLEYVDGSKISYNRLSYDDETPFRLIMEIVDKYVPEVVKKLDAEEEEED